MGQELEIGYELVDVATFHLQISQGFVRFFINGIVNEQLNKVMFKGLSGIHLVWQQLRICFDSVEPFVLVFNPHISLRSSNK
jgi:hypothetical protein